MNGNAKLRVAIGIFHDIIILCDALDSLAANGCSGGDIILLADSGALGGKLEQQFSTQSDGEAGSIHILIRNPDEIESDKANGFQSGLTEHQVIHFETWLASRFASDLDGHLQRGGCLLLCPVLSEDQERTITNVLLQYSEDRVQLHDIRPVESKPSGS